MEYTFISDPGHGWLEVPREEIFALGIESQISDYSYQHNGHVYLEEDCDAALFFDAKEMLGEAVFCVQRYEENTPIRRYAQFNGQR